jgi:hypothetical protein
VHLRLGDAFDLVAASAAPPPHPGGRRPSQLSSRPRLIGQWPLPVAGSREFARPGRCDGGQHWNGCLLDAPLPVDTGHMLELRPNCECCDRDLDPASPDVLICTYECTWCRDCAENILRGVCPNCGGELVRRPIRPAQLLTVNPPSTKRVVRPGCAPAPAR